MAQKFAVTGVSGFCGGAIAREALTQGFAIASIGRRPPALDIPHAHLDLARTGTADAVSALSVAGLSADDVLVHAAAAVGDSGDRRTFQAVNVAGTKALIDAAAQLGVRLIYISSASVYTRPTPAAVTEEWATGQHRDAYSQTKARADALCVAAGAIVLRPRAVYGVGDPHLVPRLLHRARRGVLALPGPTVQMSVTSVDLLAHASLLAAHWKPGAYNIADTEPVDRDVALSDALRAFGTTPRTVHIPTSAAMAAAWLLEAVASARATQPVVSRYAVTQLASPMVLDTDRSRTAGLPPNPGAWSTFLRTVKEATK